MIVIVIESVDKLVLIGIDWYFDAKVIEVYYLSFSNNVY